FLTPVARKGGTRETLLEAIDKACKAEEKGDLWPGATAFDVAGWQREALREQVEGFFRREVIKASLTREERLEMYRVMILTRTLDDLLKKLFQEKKIAWESYPSPQKGFRSFGQDAEARLALSLKRGRGDGDIACPP